MSIYFDVRNYAVHKFAVSPSCHNNMKQFQKKKKGGEQGPKEALIKGDLNFHCKFDVHGSVYLKRISKYNQKGANVHYLFISVKCSTCFRRFLRPSSGARNCIYRNGYFVKPLLLLLPSNSSTTVVCSSKGLTKCPVLFIQLCVLLMMGGGTA